MIEIRKCVESETVLHFFAACGLKKRKAIFVDNSKPNFRNDYDKDEENVPWK